MWLLIVALATQPEAGCIQLSLSAQKTQVLVGESTTVVVTSRVRCDTESPSGVVVLFLDDGTGYHPFVDVDEQSEALLVEGRRRLAAGEVERSSMLVGVSGRFRTDDRNRLKPELQFAFPKSGHYRLEARRRSLRSNALVVTATEPVGEDTQVLEEIQRAPELATKVGIALQREKAQQLVNAHPKSPYVGRLRLPLWEREIADALLEDRTANVNPAHGRTAAVLQSIESSDLRATAFESDRLLILARTRDRIGDPEGARLMYERIVRDHPETAAAERARARLSLPASFKK